MNEREAELDRRFREAVSAASPGTPGARAVPDLPAGLTLTDLFDAQVTSRHLDLAARRLTAAGRGYYSIGSAGHEGNVALAAVLRPTDPALLHYRSGAFFVQRSRLAGDLDPIRDVLLGVVAAAADPISGGRHKVFGSAAAAVVPMTSTIASHLPRAMGLAFALDRAALLDRDTPWPRDAVVLCSFGDASANHSTAAGAINAAIHTAHQGIPMPVLFVCEDNGVGISVPTAPDWIVTAYGFRPGLRYFEVDGSDLPQALAVSAQAADWVRRHRRPAFLRVRTVRLFGHAGSDVDTAYRPATEIAAAIRRDPVTATGCLLVATGTCDADAVLAHYDSVGARVDAVADEVVREPVLDSAAAVLAPLAPHRPDRVRTDARRPIPAHPGASDEPHDGDTDSAAITLAQAITRTLADLLHRDDDVMVFGEDVGRKGGVYGVTKGLHKTFGARRVFDTLLDEQSILGTALGTGLAGFVPIPEIQYLAYLHHALDQIRGEAATLQFFATGQYRNPLVVRIAGYAYQKGFGGHFHNDDSVAALRDIPGVVVASPARADDAAAMLRTCVSAARVDGRVCLFVEPIALYHTRDLYESGDNGWLATPPIEPVDIGAARCYGTGSDLTIVTFANGVPMSLRAARRLARHGIAARVLDLRWLAPLPEADLRHHAHATGRVLIADETRRSGGVSESVAAVLLDAEFTGPVARVTSADSFLPLGPATATVLLDDAAIEAAAIRLAGRPSRE